MDPYRNPNMHPSRQYTASNYLTGMSNQPPPCTGAQTAASVLQDGLDSGMFDPAMHMVPQRPQDIWPPEVLQNYPQPQHGRQPRNQSCSVLATQPTRSTQTIQQDIQPTQPIEPDAQPTRPIEPEPLPKQFNKLRVLCSRIPKSKGGTKETNTLTWPLQRHAPADFFHEVRKALKVPEVGGAHKLGWKTSEAKSKEPWNKLESDDDANLGFRKCWDWAITPRRVKEIALLVEVVSDPSTATEQSQTKEKPPDPAEQAYTDQLRIARRKLYCHAHSAAGNEVYCFVQTKGDKSGQHQSVSISEISLWARLVANGKADANYLSPPNWRGLDGVEDKSNTRSNSQSNRRHATEPSSSPAIHIHLPEGLEKLLGHNGTPSTPKKTSRKRDRSPSWEILDVDTASFDQTPIAEFLKQLHVKYPNNVYPQYREALESQGIMYGASICDFDNEFYEKEVGMKKGLIGPFLREAKTAVGRKKPRHASTPLSPTKANSRM